MEQKHGIRMGGLAKKYMALSVMNLLRPKVLLQLGAVHRKNSTQDIGGVGQWKLHEPWEKKPRQIVSGGDPFETTIDGKKTTVTIEEITETFGIGEAEGASSLVPVYGSGRNAVNDFQNGRYISGAFNSVMAVSDVFLVKSIGKGILQGGLKFTGKESWSTARKGYGKSGFAKPYQDVHHWGVERNSTFGKTVPGSIKNQMFNLLPMEGATIRGSFYEGATIHQALHGNSAILKLNTAEKVWYGTPSWLKAAGVSYGGRAVQGGFGLNINF